MLYCFTHKNHTGTLRSEIDADGKRRLRRFADTCLQSYKLFEKVLPF